MVVAAGVSRKRRSVDGVREGKGTGTGGGDGCGVYGYGPRMRTVSGALVSPLLSPCWC